MVELDGGPASRAGSPSRAIDGGRNGNGRLHLLAQIMHPMLQLLHSAGLKPVTDASTFAAQPGT
jgi:hypothetical protein